MKKLYAIYDKVGETTIGQIIQDRHDAPVIRMFHDVLANQDTAPGQHPDDYELRCLGQLWESGQIDPIIPPPVIATGSAWKAAQTSEK